MLSRTLNDMLTAGIVMPVLRGHPGARHDYVRAWREAEFESAELRETRQMKQIRRLVRRSLSDSRFYREHLGIGPDEVAALRSFKDLARLPVLNAAMLRRGRLEDFCTCRPRWTRIARTSGSTGQPVRVVHDLEYFSRALARRAECFARFGIVLGHREARFWGRPRGNRRRFKDVLANRIVLEMLKSGPADPGASGLLESQAEYGYGYPSILLAYAEALAEDRPERLNLRAVVRTAEGATGSQERFIRETFGCPVVNEYGCSEVEVIGFDCEAGACHVDTHHVLLEAVDDGDGNLEAVVTDLDNFTMPMVRYKLGDDIRIDDTPCSCGRTSPVIQSIVGRSADRIVQLPSGARAHSSLFSQIVGGLEVKGHSVVRFRVVQSAINVLDVYVEGVASDRREEFDVDARSRIRDGFSPDFNVNVYHETLATEPGRKHRYFVPLAESSTDGSIS